MPHATTTTDFLTGQSKAAKGSSKHLRQVQIQYDESKSLYDQSSLSKSVDAILQGKLAGRPLVTKAVSLGLGSFSEKSKDQGRRFKQLAMFISIADHVKRTSLQSNSELELYAQDPTFTKTDVLFLHGLGIRVLKTPSPSDLGEAQQVVDENALVYSPFLTIDAYKLLFGSCDVSLFIGDDFNALNSKWEKATDEHRAVEQLIKSHVSQYKRRVVSGSGFWDDDDRAFPMALYWKQNAAARVVKARL